MKVINFSPISRSRMIVIDLASAKVSETQIASKDLMKSMVTMVNE